MVSILFGSRESAMIICKSAMAYSHWSTWKDGRGNEAYHTFCNRLFHTCFGIRTLTVLIILPADTTTPVMCRRDSMVAMLEEGQLTCSEDKAMSRRGCDVAQCVKTLGSLADLFLGWLDWEACSGLRHARRIDDYR
jgi:hypothetical protein